MIHVSPEEFEKLHSEAIQTLAFIVFVFVNARPNQEYKISPSNSFESLSYNLFSCSLRIEFIETPISKFTSIYRLL